ncbi:MAG: 16S rRNA (cytosine(967)-C(5))-methyltransferase RsmB [Gammaproteobacteria bacterium]|nr:16S rRNA (cytosine(967)-C(5))-methyltransferase RsmB [Gammaproteobacteria bacterium]
MNSRAQIAKIFADILVKGSTLDDALVYYQATDDSFVKAHCYGLCRWFYRLNAIAKILLSKPLKDKDADIYALILLGLHQIYFSTIKPYAVVTETVDAVLELEKPWAKGLVNACLRRTLREKEELLENIQQDEMAFYSHSRWMIEHLKISWPGYWQTILEANNQQAPMTLRVNQKRLEDPITQFLHSCSGEWRSPSCVYLASPMPVHDILGFKEGIISIQDQASQYVAPLLQLSPDDYVLDACSAPGGKTGHLLETEPKIHLTALDISEKRLQKVKQNLERLKLDSEVTLIASDACQTEAWFQGNLFDKILIDAPCSGTGVIRRHPDIKLLRRKSDLQSFAGQQRKLLNSLWPLLSVGGKLLYTTCSVMPEENEYVIEEFLATHSDAQVQEIQLPIGMAQQHGWQCFPQINGHDGFYYCLLTKIPGL